MKKLLLLVCVINLTMVIHGGDKASGASRALRQLGQDCQQHSDCDSGYCTHIAQRFGRPHCAPKGEPKGEDE